MILNQELLQELNSSIDNEIIMVSDEMIILNKIKELIKNFIIKLQEYIAYLNNYQINIDACLDSLAKSDELLKMSTRDARIQDFNNLINSITEKYGQVNLVISSNLIYVSKLNDIKSNLLPTLLTKIMTSDIVSKDIQIIKETNEIAKILEEIILYQESINNNLDNSNLNLDESGKQLIKKST